MVKKLTIFILLIILPIAVFAFLNLSDKKPVIIAHRGGLTLLHPENSLIAFQNAIKYTNFIEMDIQFSKDNQPLVIHDSSLNRTTNCIGKIKNKNYNELKLCRLRSNINRTVSKQHIPHLEEVIQLMSTSKPTLILEIKSYDVIGIKNFMNIIKNNQNIYIQSFSLETLNYIFKKYKHKNLYLISDKLPTKYPDFLAGLILNKNFINATLLKKIDSNVLIYTIDETTDFLKFSKLDIDGIMTNDIRFFSKLIKGYDE